RRWQRQRQPRVESVRGNRWPPFSGTANQGPFAANAHAYASARILPLWRISRFAFKIGTSPPGFKLMTSAYRPQRRSFGCRAFLVGKLALPILVALLGSNCGDV